MRKTLTAAMAAITLGGALCATAAPAQAHGWDRGWHGGHYYHHHGYDGGAALAAGVVGLALGAAIADSGPHYYRSYYGPPPPPYYYGYGYRTCESTHWVWDPYWRREVPVTTRYAC